MKDTGIYVGSLSALVSTKLTLGSLSGFNFLQSILIFFFFLFVTIFGGFVGAAFQETLTNIMKKWSGKKKGLRQYLGA